MAEKAAGQSGPRALTSDILADMAFSSLSMLPDGIVVADMQQLDAPLIWAGGQFSRITGYSEGEVLGKNCRYLQGSDRLQPNLEILRKALQDGESTTVVLRNYRKDGSPFWNELTVVPYSGTSNEAAYYIGVMRDVTVSEESYDRGIREAKRDALTGLPNRDRFLEDVEKLAPSEGQRLLMIKIDIAGMHSINIAYGYAAGDEVIRKTAMRLESLKADAISRVGNNEFAVAMLLSSDADEEGALARVDSVMKPPFTVSDTIVTSRYAFGYILGSAGHLPSVLAQQAGYALHESKCDPTRTRRRFDQSAERRTALRSRITAELQQAVRDDDFTYHYQPQYNLDNGRIIGVEALLRWQHPIFGMQLPGSFISVAEETGQIIGIERKGINKIVALAKKVNEARDEPIIFSFNISPLEIARGDLPEILKEILESNRVEPSWFTVELTESLLVESSDSVMDAFHALRSVGVGLSIDDFGTGYSSLRSIDSFPITEIKIDRSFLSGLRIHGTKRIIVNTIVALGHDLGVRVVAEGIESEEQRDQLKDLGCSIGQGYLLDRPLSMQGFLDRLADVSPA